MKNRLYILSISSFVGLVLLSSCGSKVEEVAANTAFCVSDTLMKSIEFETVQPRKVVHELRLTGKVSYNQDKLVKVFPLAGGFVKELTAELGDFVKKGQVLALVRSPEIAEYYNQQISAQSNLASAQKNYSIAEELYKTKSMSEREYLGAQRELKIAEGDLYRINQILDMYGAEGDELVYTIKAPVSGFIVNKDIALNMELRTENTTEVFTISDIENVWVLANVYESDISEVKEGYETEITTIAFPDKVYKGKIDKVFNLLDPESKVLKVRITLANKDHELKPDMFANVVVKYSEDKEMLAIPSKAVIFDKNRHFVMSFEDTCKIQTRPIELYKSTSEYTYILSGVKQGDKIISKYQLLIYDALND